MGWNIGKKLWFVLLLVVFLIPLAIISTVSGLFFLMMLGVAGGSISWYFVGRLTPRFITWYLKIHQTFLRRLGSDRKIVALHNRRYLGNDRWDVFYRSLSDSFFPTVITFTVIGMALRDTGDPTSGIVFLVLFFAPVIVSITVPIRILTDSRLYYIDKKSKEIISLGQEANTRLKSVGGFLAFLLFLFTLYGLIQDLGAVLENLLVYFSFIYPTITLTSFVYFERWHDDFTRKTATRALRSGTRAVTVGLLH